MRWNDTKAIERLTKAGTVVPHLFFPYPQTVMDKNPNLKQNSGTAVTHLFDKVYRAPKADDKNVKWEHGTEANSRFYTTTTSEAKDRGAEVGFKEGKHEYLPYPQTILDKNPNLEQNPGW